MMTSDQLRNVILEAVDCLRQRKCRPDRESIAVFVMRKLGSSMSEIFNEIENIVDQGALLKVEYKGSTSYRSPKSFDLKNSPLLTKHSKILNSAKTTRYVISGMNELLAAFPKYSQEGIPYEELKNTLLKFDQDRFADSGVKVIFEREEAAGTLQVAESEDLVFPIRIFPKDLPIPTGMKVISFVENNTNNLPEKGKKKRAKKSQDGDSTQKPLPTSGSASPGKKNVKVKRKKKEDVVYAVKSTPNVIEVDVGPDLQAVNNDSDEFVKAKAEQISSIGLKVMAGKLSKGNSNGKGDSIKEKLHLDQMIERKPSLALVTDAKPALALVKHEEKSAEIAVNGKSIKNTVRSKPSGTNISENVPSKPHKRKNEHTANSPRKKSQVQVKVDKAKKPKLELSSDDSDDQFMSVSLMPPRYTYSARKRVRDSYTSNLDGSIFQSPSTIKSGSSKSNGSGHKDACEYCHKQENSAGVTEDFLSCGSCNAKIHPTCIDYSEDQAKRLRLNSKLSDSDLQWQCFSCKRCGVCQNALMSSGDSKESHRKKEQRYVLCDRCDRGYHASCINRVPPNPLHENPLWYCSECEETSSGNDNEVGSSSRKTGAAKKKYPVKKGTPTKCQNKNINKSSKTSTNANGGNVTPTTSSSKSVSIGNTADDIDIGDPAEIPDISSWTPSQVQKYFAEKGLKEEAASLREQEIDGMSLLLLRRADVIFGLNLRLGPALKIYRLVCQLQQHSSALKKIAEAENKTATASNSKSIEKS